MMKKFMENTVTGVCQPCKSGELRWYVALAWLHGPVFAILSEDTLAGNAFIKSVPTYLRKGEILTESGINLDAGG